MYRKEMPRRGGGRERETDRPPYNERMASDLNTSAGLAKYMVKDSLEMSWKLSSPSITCNLIHKNMPERNYWKQHQQLLKILLKKPSF
jgi:hypothetical protein